MTTTTITVPTAGIPAPPALPEDVQALLRRLRMPQGGDSVRRDQGIRLRRPFRRRPSQPRVVRSSAVGDHAGADRTLPVLIGAPGRVRRANPARVIPLRHTAFRAAGRPGSADLRRAGTPAPGRPRRPPRTARPPGPARTANAG